jgi:benzoyl-CoA reductase/2-hydroxyglutaryl-CoA dehydratase subunit BcrC/BadD/HgdB
MHTETISFFHGLRERNVVEVKKAKENGSKFVGMYCTYAPKELIVAAGAIPLMLCGTKQEPIPAAEQHLPRNLCPLIKSSYGFAITDTCPYFHFSDVVVAETTCDGKKKMYELMQEIKPMHIMQLPQSSEGENALEFWREEVYRFKKYLEKSFQVEITEERMRDAIKSCNEERRVLKAFYELNKAKPAPLSGKDMLNVLWARGFYVHREEGIDKTRQLTEEIRSSMAVREEELYRGPRVLLTGVPIGLGSDKVLNLLEESGAVVIALENCTGLKSIEGLVDEIKDPITAIAEKYINIPCSCMSPNTGRYELLDQLIKDYQVDGVVDLTWQGCHTYNIESYSIAKSIRETHGIPMLQIETDYSTSDLQQLKVRIDAFVEMLDK